MKKKAILIIMIIFIVSLCSMPVFASIHGVFEGYNIVKVMVNGEVVESDVPAINFKGRTLVPVRFVAEALGANVEWDQETYTASINTITVETISFPNGDKYIGPVVNGMPDGVGVYMFASGDRLVGEFKNGLPNGRGAFIWANGDKLEGVFCDGAFNGLGTYTWPNGDRFIGEYKNGLPHGLGVYQWVNGEFQAGIYENGELISAGAPSNYPEPPVIYTPELPPIDTPDVIESYIDGTFEGWTGDTVFKLVNGQIWQQTSFAYTYHYAFRPKVLIYRSGPVYKMRVDGVRGEITVTRLK